LEEATHHYMYFKRVSIFVKIIRTSKNTWYL